jgi:hypothetical protein
MKKYARKCDVTGKGMNEGWCWGEGVYYTSTKEATIKELRSDIKDGAYDFDELGSDAMLQMSDDDLLQYAYDNDVFYYTDWHDEDLDEQGYYYTEDGEEIEI